MATAAKVLWTKQVRKKSKSYNDGFLLISAGGQATLYDETGKELSTASNKLPYGLAADPASAEQLSCFEGYLVDGDCPCEPSDIAAARGVKSSPDNSAISTSMHHASTSQHQHSGSGYQQLPRGNKPVGVLHRGCAGIGSAGQAPSAAGRPKAPLLERKLSRNPSAANEAAGAPAKQLSSCAGAVAPPAGQYGMRQQQGISSSNAGVRGGDVSTRWTAEAGAAQGAMGQTAGADSAWAPNPRSDNDIMQLLESIGPQDTKAPASSSAGQGSFQQVQQLHQHHVRPLPAVPQFGRQQKQPGLPAQQKNTGKLQQRWQQQPRALQTLRQGQQPQQEQQWAGPQQIWQQQPQQQQQPLHQRADEWPECSDRGLRQTKIGCRISGPQQALNQPDSQQRYPCTLSTGQQQQEQQDLALLSRGPQPQHEQQWQQQWPSLDSIQTSGTGVEAGTAAAAAGSATSQSARNACSAAQPPAALANSGGMQGRQVLQPVQPDLGQQQQARGLWHQPQQQQQQQLQQKARTLWGQPQQQQVAPMQDACGGGGGAGAGASGPKAPQQQAGFKIPRAVQPPSASTAGHSAGGGAPDKADLTIPQQQQQQQGAVQGYCYPGPATAALQRLVKVPMGFSSQQQYVAVLTAALTEEVNLHLASQARSFYNIVRQVQAAPAAQGPYQQQQGHWHGQQRQLQGVKQQGGSDLASRLQAACGRAGLRYHPAASLTVYNNSSSRGGGGRGGGPWGKGKKRCRGYGRAAEDDGEGADEEEKEAAAPSKAVSMYLALPGKLDRRQFRKHDLWVLSNNTLLQASAADSSSSSSSGPYDRLSQPWVILARSCWHGPDKDGKMEVALLPGQQQQLPPHHKWQRQQSLTALQGPDVATEVQVTDFIGSTDLRAWPLLSSLMKPCQGQVQPAAAAAAAAAAGNEGGGVAAVEGFNSTTEGQQGEGVDDDSSGSQEVLPGRRRKRRLQQVDDNSSSSDHEAAEADASCPAAAAAAAGSASEEDDSEPCAAATPGKRIRHAAAAAGGVAVYDGDSSLDDSLGCIDSEPADDQLPVVDGTTAAAAAAAATGQGVRASAATNTAAAAQALLSRVVQQFRLNPAQAAVAAHVADWLPQLTQDVQQRQQQGKKLRGIVKPRASALTANRAPLAAAAVAGSSGGSSSSSRAPVCLIHGPFGSGKSTLLVALIHLLTSVNDQQEDEAASSSKAQQQLQQQRPSPRILVAAHTNVAVDRVLLGLQEAGFTNMLRIGSLARIAKRLLGVSLHSADDSRDALSQLNGMLRDAAGAEEAMIRSEIAAIQAGAERRRRKALSTAAVVGITCCSALQSTLEGQVFDVVLLDEASQMTEPTSLVPLLRVKPRFVIAAGDPCQLPPVLASPTGVTPTAAAAAAGPGGMQNSRELQQQGGRVYGLLRPLFVRLTQLGHEPHLLTHQYRCHPMLSLLSNKHFYNSRLLDGVTAGQRRALVPSLPPLVMCDCQGGASQAAGGGSRSSINRAEANLVAQLVGWLLTVTGSQTPSAVAAAAGPGGSEEQGMEADEAEEGSDRQVAPVLKAHQLGVICFFRGQAALIKQSIAADPSCISAADVQIATVDSFQGAEKEVIILATTTTDPHSEFCSDGARLNVALTRARRHLVVVGAAAVLAQTPSSVFRELVTMTRSGQHNDAAYLPGGRLLQLLTQQV